MAGEALSHTGLGCCHSGHIEQFADQRFDYHAVSVVWAIGPSIGAIAQVLWR